MENADMSEIRKALSDIQTNLQGLQQEIQGVKQGLQQEIQGVKQGLQQEIQGVKQGLQQEIQGVKQELQYLTILVEQDTNKKIEALFDGRTDELRYREILKVTVGKVDNHEMRIDLLEKASRVS